MTTLAIALVLVVFGFLTGFSIGAPFFILGIGLLILHPFRSRRRMYWSLLVGLVAFLAGTALVMPMRCTASGVVGGSSETVCTSLIGMTWSASGVYNPPPEARNLAIGVGLVGGAVAAITTWTVLTFRQKGRGVT
jgi:hypothetical protein